MSAPSLAPIIGIASRPVEPLDRFAPTEGVRSDYVRAVEAAGGVPLFFPLTKDLKIIERVYALVHGVLLPGGEDIDPARYGEARHETVQIVSPVRDEVELALAAWAVRDKKPLFGICRGAQVLNVALGGTLFQDVPSEFRTPLVHSDSSTNEAARAVRHEIAVESGSLLSKLINGNQIVGNSLHHQSLRKIAPGLKVVAHSPDGVVEAVEGTGESFVVGVQCHPELLYLDDPRWLNVFRGFVAEAGRYVLPHER